MFSNKDNLILIGMPGCGKSTIGKNAARLMSMDFLDVDSLIESKECMSISDIFLKGEEYFRNVETAVISGLSGVKNTVISTGGGVVKKDSNLPILKDIGFIIFINRPMSNILSDINTSSRPLLNGKSDALAKLYNERFGLYKKFCHTELQNNGTLEDITDKVISAYKGRCKL